MTPWWTYLLALLAPVCLVNVVPHFVAAVSGRRFPTPFVGGPPNLDSPQRNVIWAGMNLVVGVLLLWAIGASLADPVIVAELIAVGLLFAWFLAGIFSRLP